MTQKTKNATWFRVCGTGISGAPKRSEEAAWDSWERAARRARGYNDDTMGEAKAAHAARCYGATTRAAAREADVSVSAGRQGSGEFWALR